MLRRSSPFVLGLALLAAACTSARTGPGERTTDPLGGPALPATGPSGSTDASADGGLAFDPRHVLTEQTAWVAIASERYLPMYKEPGPRKNANFVFDTRNPIGRRSPFLVSGAEEVHGRTWLRLLLPIRPNGRTAWVKDRDVRLVPREDRIVVDLSKRMLWHYRDGKLVDRFAVGVGTPSTPTPVGTFYLYIRVPQSNPSGPYGILAFGLSGFSPVISDWPGGGRAAIHGTPYESNKGQAVSHGCVRVWNADMKTLRDLPLGTPVIIRR